MKARKELLEFVNLYDWDTVSMLPDLPEDFIREFKQSVNWNSISMCNTNLSINFVKEFELRLNWVFISSFQDLSEEFIREFKDSVIWYYIKDCQKLSKEFKQEFKNYL